MKQWPIDQMVYLVKHYAAMPIEQLSAELGRFGIPRSPDACYSKARDMGLKRDNSGRFTPDSGRAFAVATIHPTPVRKAIIEIMMRDVETTIAAIALELSVRRSSVYRILVGMKFNTHIARWNPSKNGNHEAVYRIGAGIDAEPPTRRQDRRKDPKPNIEAFTPSPIPVPVLGPWGCSWPTTTPLSAAERNQA